MQLRAVFGLVIGAGVLAGCASPTVGPVVVDRGAGAVVNAVESRLCSEGASPIAAVCRGLDLARTAAIPRSSQSEISYAETDAFDRQLHASMKGEVPNIKVTFGDVVPTYTALTQVPRTPAYDSTQLVFWQAKVLNSGGSIAVCEKAPYESILSVLGSIVADILFNLADDWLTYRPARAYDAMLIVSRTNNEGEPEFKVDRAHYRLRSDPASLDCPVGTLQYALLGRPG